MLLSCLLLKEKRFIKILISSQFHYTCWVSHCWWQCELVSAECWPAPDHDAAAGASHDTDHTDSADDAEVAGDDDDEMVSCWWWLCEQWGGPGRCSHRGGGDPGWQWSPHSRHSSLWSLMTSCLLLPGLDDHDHLELRELHTSTDEQRIQQSCEQWSWHCTGCLESDHTRWTQGQTEDSAPHC